MTSTDLTLAVYTICNILRALACLPQIARRAAANLIPQ
jgi:hypothetical protein